MNGFRLKVGLDVDDVLFSCCQYAIDLTNAYGKFTPPLSIQELTEWGPSGKRVDAILECFHQENFFETQPVIDGAQEFVSRLSVMAEVFLITAVSPEFASIRIKRLLEIFPQIPKENIIIAYRKDLINDIDIILDDKADNIITSKSAYPVLMRRPWNKDMTGCLAVNNYEEFLMLIETVYKSFSTDNLKKGNKCIVLVGPSASGKTELLNRMTKKGVAEKCISYTTRQRRENETDTDYHFVTEEQFFSMKSLFFETTCYAGAYYGSSLQDVKNILQRNNAIMALDICGAIAVKKAFPNQSLLIFISRPKKELIKAILDRNISNEEKTNRIISLSDEYKNQKICDAVIHNDSTLEHAEKELKFIIESY